MAQGRAAVQINNRFTQHFVKENNNRTSINKVTIVHLLMLSLYFQCHNKKLLGFNMSLGER